MVNKILMKRHFTFKDDKSDKFWSVEISGKIITVVFGKTNSAGRTNSTELPSEAVAQKEFEKLIKEKLAKGYIEHVGDSAGRLTETEFWNLIERAKKNAEDMEEQVERLVELLVSRSVEDLVEFKVIFQTLFKLSYQSRLWAAAYIVKGGCSDDAFDYFRGWLIAKGKDSFYKCLENPEHLAKIVTEDDVDLDVEYEDMLSVSASAFERKTGKTMDEFYDLFPQEIFSLPEIVIDWEEEGEQLKKLFPKLCKKFWE